MSDAPTTTQYELTAGSIALLREILPTPTWYKDDSKQGLLLSRSVDAFDALPELDEGPKKEDEEKQKDFEKRAKEWADKVYMFSWSDKERDAVKKCVQYYLKQGSFRATKYTRNVLKLFSLHDE